MTPGERYDDPDYPEGWYDDDGWNECACEADEAEEEREEVIA